MIRRGICRLIPTMHPGGINLRSQHTSIMARISGTPPSHAWVWVEGRSTPELPTELATSLWAFSTISPNAEIRCSAQNRNNSPPWQCRLILPWLKSERRITVKLPRHYRPTAASQQDKTGSLAGAFANSFQRGTYSANSRVPEPDNHLYVRSRSS